MSDQQKLRKAIVRSPGVSFVKGLTTAQLGVPDYHKAIKQHAAYCEALGRCGLSLTRLEPDERFPDSTFVEDTAVIVSSQKSQPERGPGCLDASEESNGVIPDSRVSVAGILTRPGAASRVGEVDSIATVLAQLCTGLTAIEEPGTLDGGDVCEAGDHCFIGISDRTNEAGARQLTVHLASNGYTSSLVDVRSVKNILHLKSGLAYLGDNRLVVIDALADHPAFVGYELVQVNASEQYAANCVRINGRVLVAAGYSMFEGALRELGYDTIALEMSEFRKMDGGLSCLSLRL